VERFLIVCGAGSLGCGARYVISMWAGERIGTSFPWGTLIVNVLGSFIIALVFALAGAQSERFPPNLQLALTTGFCGGFTTYSSFNYESTTLAFGDYPLRALANLLVTVILCFGAGLLGMWIGRRFGA
jgi:fluoride exporter